MQGIARNCCTWSREIVLEGGRFWGRLRDFVVALSFLAVSKDALAEQQQMGAKQFRISKEDYTKTLKRPGFLIRKILAPIKIKSALPPPPPAQKKTNSVTPSPPKPRNFMGMGFYCRKNAIFPGAHKIGAAISGPRIADKTLYGPVDFSDSFPENEGHYPLSQNDCRQEK